MKEIYLQKVKQYGTECYIGKMDPRKLVKVAKHVEASDTQDAQRPLNAKRVKDIAKYVSNEKGILPNTLTIATNDNSFAVNVVDADKGIYSIRFPETPEEFENYKEKIDVMDGQHRLYSFQDDYNLMPDDETYEIGFTLYVKPTLYERRRIFVSCNEKQEKVSGNLLMWFREQLNMLNTNEAALYNLVSKLNDEFPLKGHIIMSAEKVKNGVKAKEVMLVLEKAEVLNFSIQGNKLTEQQLIKLICSYLTAWQQVVGFSFTASSGKTTGAAVKIAGLRLMLMVLPAVWDRSITKLQKFTEEYVKETLIAAFEKLRTQKGYFFKNDEFFICETHKNAFRERSATEQFAKELRTIVTGLSSDDFDPLA